MYTNIFTTTSSILCQKISNSDTYSQKFNKIQVNVLGDQSFLLVEGLVRNKVSHFSCLRTHNSTMMPFFFLQIMLNYFIIFLMPSKSRTIYLYPCSVYSSLNATYLLGIFSARCPLQIKKVSVKR